MVIAAQAGTPLSEIEATLAEKGQRLTFEPTTLQPLYGSQGAPTIGAVAACNLSGPRRIHSGAARDALIGVRLVTGRGETIKSGGRVMKNVTGYDLVKFSAGTLGTLGVLTEVTFKVLPAPETETTLVFEKLDDEAATRCMSEALGSPWEVTGAAHLPGRAEPSRTLLRIEGFESQTSYRSKVLAEALAEYGTPATVEAEESRRLWSGIGELQPLDTSDDRVVWKISTTPTRGPDVAGAIARSCDAGYFYDWGGGLIWVSVESGSDAHGAAIRSAVADHGGHATLMHAPDDVRNSVDVFPPRPEAVMALSRRLKESFDPDGILNPGRMYAGI
jgi:glycolate oxidase FAD binding subunit